MYGENSPGMRAPTPPEPEDPSDGADATDHSTDLSDGPDLVEQTALQQFAFALQEAQRLAVQLERDQAHQKHKKPKTYRGNSRMTRYHREKTRKSLASKGFLDIRSFLELKQQEREERDEQEEHKHKHKHKHGSGGEGPNLSRAPVITDCMTPGGRVVNEVGEDSEEEEEIILLPGPLAGPVNFVRYRGGDAKEGAYQGADANAEEPGAANIPGPGPVAGKQCECAEEEESWSEEEESEEGGIGVLPDRVRVRSAHGLGSAKCTIALRNTADIRCSGLVARMQYGHEEEEESGCDEPKEGGKASTVNCARSRRSGCADLDSDNSEGHGADEADTLPHSVGFARGGSGTDSDKDSGSDSDKLEDDLALPRLGDSRRILDAALKEICRSHVPTDIGPLTRADKALDVWKDRERLQSACVALSAMSKNTNFDVILRARLTGMVGVLNLYLDPVLRYTWRSASVMVSKIEGKGVNHARMLRQWILEFVRSEKLPQPNYSHSHWTVLDDEDISQFLQLQIMAHTKGHYLTASSIVKVVASEEVQEKFSRLGITKPTISEHTARRWLQKLNWHYGLTQHGMYLDGHECPDVVAYREAFVGRWKQYERRFYLWDNDSNLLPLPKGFPVPGFRFRLILVTHDESTFYQNDLRKTHWAHESTKATPCQKGDGQSIMVSDFLTSEWGRLCDGQESVKFPFLRPTIS
jgi:hypothetical protein